MLFTGRYRESHICEGFTVAHCYVTNDDLRRVDIYCGIRFKLDSVQTDLILWALVLFCPVCFFMSLIGFHVHLSEDLVSWTVVFHLGTEASNGQFCYTCCTLNPWLGSGPYLTDGVKSSLHIQGTMVVWVCPSPPCPWPDHCFSFQVASISLVLLETCLLTHWIANWLTAMSINSFDGVLKDFAIICQVILLHSSMLIQCEYRVHVHGVHHL